MLRSVGKRSFQFSRHCVLSAIYPIGGFQFSPKTAFYPMKQVNDDDVFKMDMNKGLHLRSGLFQPSINFHYFTALPIQTREHLVIDYQQQTVSNGFENPIHALLLRDSNDQYFTSGSLVPGETGKLERLDEKEILSTISARNADLLWDFFIRQNKLNYLDTFGVFKPRGRYRYGDYLILFDGRIKTNQAGVGIKNDLQTNVLYGLVAPSES